MSEETKEGLADRRLPSRVEELWAEVDQLSERLAHLRAQACAVEAGQTIVRRRFDAKGQVLGWDETLKPQPAAAAAYWREVHKLEARLREVSETLRVKGFYGDRGIPPRNIVQVDHLPPRPGER
ncbi:MAG: hypothetical protein FJ291_32940 [Planctomycetes bacterium]|nr:hypothetical protein [Planctomycetota bacterium]